MNDELEKKKKEEADKAAADAATKVEEEKKKAVDEATNKLNEELKKAQDELKKLQDKDYNFGKVTKTAEEKEKEVEELKKKIGELELRPVNEARDNALSAYSGTDKALREKMEYHFGRLGKDAKTATEVEAAMKEAFLLSTGKAAPVDITRNHQGSGGGNNRVAPVNSGEINSEVKEWAGQMNRFLPKNLQITDEDLKNPKYQVQPGQSNN